MAAGDLALRAGGVVLRRYRPDRRPSGYGLPLAGRKPMLVPSLTHGLVTLRPRENRPATGGFGWIVQIAASLPVRFGGERMREHAGLSEVAAIQRGKRVATARR